MPRTIVAVALSAFGVAGCLILAGGQARAQQFSAEIVGRDQTGAVVGKPARLYAADRKVRIETPELQNHVLIIDGAKPAAYAVAPAQRMFLDAMQSSPLTQLFVPLDPDDPCPQWHAMAEVAGISVPGEWRCNAEVRETVDGRNTVRFSMISPLGRNTDWIDTQLKFPVRIETRDGTVLALQDIREEPQPADKFEIPADYKKLNPRRLLELIKQSDIWVEPPSR
jgi:hypothetical protein